MSDDRCDVLCLDVPLAERLRETRLSLEVADQGAGRARALSDPTRLMLAVAVRVVVAMERLVGVVGRIGPAQMREVAMCAPVRVLVDV